MSKDKVVIDQADGSTIIITDYLRPNKFGVVPHPEANQLSTVFTHIDHEGNERGVGYTLSREDAVRLSAFLDSYLTPNENRV